MSRGLRRRVPWLFWLCLSCALMFNLGSVGATEPAHADTGEPSVGNDIDWVPAPMWPFRGVVAQYGYEARYWPHNQKRDTDQLGLQFLDTANNETTYVRLSHDIHSDNLRCAQSLVAQDTEGVIWVIDGGLNRGNRRSWYVPWGDLAYPLFAEDVEYHFDLEGVIEDQRSKYGADSDFDLDSMTFSIGDDGRSLMGWWQVMSEPGCGGTHLLFATDTMSGDVVACGWSRATAIFVNPDGAIPAKSVAPKVPSHEMKLYQTCDLLNLRQWQRVLATRDGAWQDGT